MRSRVPPINFTFMSAAIKTPYKVLCNYIQSQALELLYHKCVQYEKFQHSVCVEIN